MITYNYMSAAWVDDDGDFRVPMTPEGDAAIIAAMSTNKPV